MPRDNCNLTEEKIWWDDECDLPDKIIQFGWFGFEETDIVWNATESGEMYW